MTSIYSTQQGIVYQRGNSRVIHEKKGGYVFEVKKGGKWVMGRQSYIQSTIDKVKAEIKA